jgi:chromosome segregation ATPase
VNDDILSHLIDIKDRLGSIETLGTELKDDLKEHARQSQKTQERVGEIETELAGAKGSIKALKWVFGVPAGALALIEMAKVIVTKI